MSDFCSEPISYVQWLRRPPHTSHELRMLAQEAKWNQNAAAFLAEVMPSTSANGSVGEAPAAPAPVARQQVLNRPKLIMVRPDPPMVRPDMLSSALTGTPPQPSSAGSTAVLGRQQKFYPTRNQVVEATAETALTGSVVKVFKSSNRGWCYAFVAPDTGGANVFVHHTAFQGEGILAEGDRVAFEVPPRPSPNGRPPAACNVRKLAR